MRMKSLVLLLSPSMMLSHHRLLGDNKVLMAVVLVIFFQLVPPACPGCSGYSEPVVWMPRPEA